MAQPHFIVVGVMGRRDLDRAGAERGVHKVVGNHREAPPQDRQHRGTADVPGETLVLPVGGHRRVARDRLRACCGHFDEFGRPFGPATTTPWMVGPFPVVTDERVADGPQMVVVLLRDGFQVRDGALAAGTPVHEVGTAVDQAFPVQLHKSGPHGVAQAIVQGKALPLPVTTHPKALVLLCDTGMVDLLPLPHLLHKLFPAEVVASDALLGQFPLHHVLGSNACVIAAGQEQSLVAIHPEIARHQVFDSGRQGMPQVQSSRDVGRRHGDAPCRFVGIGQPLFDQHFGLEEALRFPPVVQPSFGGVWIVDFLHLIFEFSVHLEPILSLRWQMLLIDMRRTLTSALSTTITSSPAAG